MRHIILGFALAVGLAGLSWADEDESGEGAGGGRGQWSQEELAKIEARYQRTCGICHTAGVANAPTTGVPEEWEERLARGMDALLQVVHDGLGAMPPKGMCFDCTDEDFIDLIEYMAAPPADPEE